ncbi:MAG: hypothetical protein ACKPHU_31965, partial [Planctomycetaceae bacterium]
MIILDTDHFSCLEWGSEDSSRLRERLADVPDGSVAVSMISDEKQMVGGCDLPAPEGRNCPRNPLDSVRKRRYYFLQERQPEITTFIRFQNPCIH